MFTICSKVKLPAEELIQTNTTTVMIHLESSKQQTPLCYYSNQRWWCWKLWKTHPWLFFTNDDHKSDKPISPSRPVPARPRSSSCPWAWAAKLRGAIGKGICSHVANVIVFHEFTLKVTGERCHVACHRGAERAADCKHLVVMGSSIHFERAATIPDEMRNGGLHMESGLDSPKSNLAAPK